MTNPLQLPFGANTTGAVMLLPAFLFRPLGKKSHFADFHCPGCYDSAGPQVSGIRRMWRGAGGTIGDDE